MNELQIIGSGVLMLIGVGTIGYLVFRIGLIIFNDKLRFKKKKEEELEK